MPRFGCMENSGSLISYWEPRKQKDSRHSQFFLTTKQSNTRNTKSNPWKAQNALVQPTSQKFFPPQDSKTNLKTKKSESNQPRETHENPQITYTYPTNILDFLPTFQINLKTEMEKKKKRKTNQKEKEKKRKANNWIDVTAYLRCGILERLKILHAKAEFFNLLVPSLWVNQPLFEYGQNNIQPHFLKSNAFLENYISYYLECKKINKMLFLYLIFLVEVFSSH